MIYNYITKIMFQVEWQEKYNPGIDRNWLKDFSKS